jgi:Bacterial Ig-like domain (group 3)/Right handed beta helix region
MGDLRLPCDTSRNARASRMGRVWAGFKNERRGPRARHRPREVRFESLEGRLLLSTFTVLNTDDSGAGSMRQAILDADGATGANTIAFDIPGAGVQTIAPLSALPTITAPVTIDGYTQPDSSPGTLPPGEAPDAVLSIELSGALAGTDGVNGLEIAGGNSTVRGLVIDDFSGDGIDLTTEGGDLIEGDYIGTDPTGSIAEPNLQGISIVSGTGNTIGGTTAGSRNLISGNLGYGAGVYNFAAEDTLIEGNLIGTDARGVKPLGNNGTGLELQGSLVILGGTIEGAGNVISGNGGDGVLAVTGDLIERNYIGTDASGFQRLGNGGDGIDLAGPNNTVGGTNALTANVISGNAGSGVRIGNASDNLIEGNYIGPGAPSTEPINVGNGGDGVTILSDSPEDQGSDNNTIGGTADGAGNEIAFNGGNGVTIANSGPGTVTFSPTGDTILGDSVFSNAKLGIDLGDDGPTPNTPGGPHTGPNDLQNYPVITSAVPGNETVTLSGTLNSTPDTRFLLQFFGNLRELTPGIFAGQVVMGTASVTTDSLGNATFSANFFDFGGPYSATATDTNGNTSEFSAAISSTTLSPTTTTLTGSPSVADVGQLVTFTADVSPQDSSAGPSTLDDDSVLFTVDGGASTSVPLQAVDGQDVATLTTSALLPGTHAITASFAGDATFAASSSPVAQVTINSAPTTTTLSAPQVTAMVGQPLSFEAIVSQPNPDPTLSSDLITGPVTFTIDGQAGAPVALQDINGQEVATLSTSTLAAGAYTVTASFAGDGTFAASVSNTEKVTIDAPSPMPTTTTVSASPSSAQGQPVVLTAVVASSGPTPATGDVTFTIDGVAQAPGALSVVNGQAVATLTLNALAQGVHAVTASYDGSGTFAASTSHPAISVQVLGPAVAPDGPLVMSFQRFGYHSQPSVLVLTFNKGLDPTTADDAANYRIVPLGPHGKFGPSIAIKRIDYDATARTVTLHPSQRLNVHKRFGLLVDGTSTHAVADRALHDLDGGRTGQSGSDFDGLIDWSTLAGPSLSGRKYTEFWMKLSRHHEAT